MNDETEKATAWSVVMLALARLCVNMTRRFAYPFLPEISRELGVSLVSVQGAVASQSASGLASPLFGGLSERYGRKRVMLAALVVLCLLCLPGIFFPEAFGVFYAFMLLAGVAKFVFDPTMQAYIADRVPYWRRARAIGITELAWAGSLFVAAPLTGYLLDVNGMALVYTMILGMNSAGLLLVWRFVEADRLESQFMPHASMLPAIVRMLAANPAALVALSFTVFLYMANEMLLIVYGDWMEKRFDLVLAVLGTVTIVIAAGEVIGEFLVIGAADRWGKRRLTLMGVLISSLGYCLLPYVDVSLLSFMLGLFVVVMMAEAAIVASISLFTEVLPEARAVMMSSNIAAQAIGRFVGAFLGGSLYRLGGFELSGAIAMGIGMIAVVIMWRLVREHQPSSSTGAI